MGRYWREEGCYSGEELNDGMNGWNGETISPADTYIEWRFEVKCKQLSNGFKIITEWRKRKLHYQSLINTTIMDFQHYSRHDVTHSISILESIEALLGKKRIDLLSAGDLWLLLEAAFSHDSGMALNYEDIQKLWKEDEKFSQYVKDCIEDDFGDLRDAALYYRQMDNLLNGRKKMFGIQNGEEVHFNKDWPIQSQQYFSILIAEYVRKLHSDRILQLQEEEQEDEDTVIPSRLYCVAAKVSAMHGRNFGDMFSELKYSTKGFGSGALHPQFAAAMLRIGDLLDMDNNRFDPYAIKHFGRLPLASLLHYKKHKSVSHISITEEEIEAEAHAREYDVCLIADNWFQAIDEEVKNLICNWNMIVPEALLGCTMRPSKCSVYLLDKNGTSSQKFGMELRREFTINKKKMINLLIGTSIYEGEMDFLREYLQNAFDASKMQLWLELKKGKYDQRKNPEVLKMEDLTPFDLEKSVYYNFCIKFYVGWNEKKDKIELQIIDQGIGIEEEYLSELSNIGTGWKGRSEYYEELKQMLPWLRPTGGFGIGIQSAFMVTDDIELRTKSDRNLYGSKVLLSSPDRGGQITREELRDYTMRGTTVVIQIEPEKIQYWMEALRKHESGNAEGDTEKDYAFDSSRWDEFDDDAILLYTQQFLLRYIKSIVPDPLFPIEIACSGLRTQIWHNPYLTEENYWDNKTKYLAREITEGDKTYLCFCLPGEDNRKYLVYWDRKDWILGEIHPENEGRKKICFKNIKVKYVDYSELELFYRYGICLDFMGFRAEECLKVHRNSFHEKFDIVGHCEQGFRIYLRYLWEIMQEPEGVYEEKVKKQLESIWKSYPLQLLRMIRFYDYPVAGYVVTEENLMAKRYEVVEEDNGNSMLAEKETEISSRDFLKEFDALLKKADDNEGSGTGIILVPTKENWALFNKREKDCNRIGIMSLQIGKWLKKGIDGDDNREKRNVIKYILDKKEFVTDPFTVKMLLMDTRLIKLKIDIDTNERFILLTKERKIPVLSEADIFQKLGAKKETGGRIFIRIENEASGCYSSLWVESRPYQVRDDFLYLISPVSVSARTKVAREIERKKKLTYEDFRKIVWGKKGEENTDYHMLISWVTRHQHSEFPLSKEAIADEYEKLLQDFFEKFIFGEMLEKDKKS